MLWKMGWRNLWRNKRRTIITVLSVAFGVWLSCTFIMSGDYSYTNMINAGARMGYGHVTVQPNGYLETPGLDRRLQDVNSLREEVLKTPGVARASVRIGGQAMFATASKSVGGAFIAVDPAQETPEDNLILDALVEGKMFDKSTSRGVVIGRLMSEKLNLKLGKKLVYTLVDVDGEIVGNVARVSGIYHTGVEEVDGSMVLLPLDAVKKTLKYKTDEATMVAVMIGDHRKSKAIREAVAAAVGNPEREVLTWKETAASVAGMVELDRTMNYLMQLLIGLLIAAGVFNTILMSVLERRREFGVMMAIGTMPGELFRLVSVEAIYVGLVGLVMGAALYAPTYYYLITTGIDMSAAMGAEMQAGGVLVDPVIRAIAYPEKVAAILLGVFLLTMLAGIYPAIQAGRDRPVEALKTI